MKTARMQKSGDPEEIQQIHSVFISELRTADDDE